MHRVPLIQNEQERLEALRSYGILDTQAEVEFDELTKLASQLCETPISLVSLVDSNRQWFKSAFGMERTETARGLSFCTHAIEKNEILVVEDARLDQRFKDNPYVNAENGIRFYAGIPLVNKQGYALGTLCVVDLQPRTLSELQREGLRVLAKQVITHLDLRRSFMESEKRQIAMAYHAKLSALGEMASSIAHEINNPLAVARGQVEILIERFENSTLTIQETRVACERLQRVIERISKTVSGLRAFARNDVSDPLENVSIKKIFEDTQDLCTNRFKDSGVPLEVEIGNESWSLRCHPIQVEQIVLNLLNNALDAISGQPKPWVRLTAQQTQRGFEIAVTDSGNGIPEELRAKLMQKFFTTKPPGKGIGLGLSISKSIAEAHGGTLVLDTSSANTRFVLTLPATTRSSEVAA